MNRVIVVSQVWNDNYIEPDGTSVIPADASSAAGVISPHVGNVFAKDSTSEVVGISFEMCTRLNDGMYWHCEGTHVDLVGCKGQLSFTGTYTDETSSGMLTITGGTGDFLGATGYIETVYDEVQLITQHTIVIA